MTVDWRNLIARARAGNEDALAEILKRLKLTIKGIICRQRGLTAEDEREEALHVANIKIWQVLGLADLAQSQRDLEGWLFRVGVNAAKDWWKGLRGRNRRVRVITDVVVEHHAAGESYNLQDVPLEGEPVDALTCALPDTPPCLSTRNCLCRTLREVYRHIERHGTITGAVKAYAAKHGLDEGEASQRIDAAMARFRERDASDPLASRRRGMIEGTTPGSRDESPVSLLEFCRKHTICKISFYSFMKRGKCFPPVLKRGRRFRPGQAAAPALYRAADLEERFHWWVNAMPAR
jgi:DNA-directed RNA polymerase specialized sigma24 family protein